MSTMPISTAAGAVARSLLRRRLALSTLVLLPVVLYLIRRDSTGQALRALAFGVTWVVSTLAFFATRTAAETRPRLELLGWSRWRLATARAAGLLAVTTLTVVVPYVGLLAADQPALAAADVALTLTVAALVAMAVGTAVGDVQGREFEGALLVFFFAAVQAVVAPSDAIARWLPFWSSRELATWAVDGPGAGSSRAALAHAAAAIVVTAAVSLVAGRRRRA